MRITRRGLRIVSPPHRFVAPRFNDLRSIDKLVAVQAKADAVRDVVADSIDAALRNADRLDDIEGKVETLSLTASRFSAAAGSVKRTMRCRYWKLMLLFSVLAAAILIAIIVPLVLQAQKN